MKSLFSVLFALAAVLAAASASPASGSPAAGEDEAAPTRTWTDSSAAFTMDAQFVGLEDGKVKLKKTDGKIVTVPLDRLSKEDQEFVKSATQPAGKPVAARELTYDDGQKAGQRSIAGGGHAVKFEVEGDSWHVTSVRLHGSRYGYPRPPQEDFRVWICDESFKPIATFKFPYSSYNRGAAKWVTFNVKPTRVPPKFYVCFGFNPEQTKGIYVSMDKNAGKHSYVGVPGEMDPEPLDNGNWLIRCKVEKRKAGK